MSSDSPMNPKTQTRRTRLEINAFQKTFLNDLRAPVCRGSTSDKIILEINLFVARTVARGSNQMKNENEVSVEMTVATRPTLGS